MPCVWELCQAALSLDRRLPKLVVWNSIQILPKYNARIHVQRESNPNIPNKKIRCSCAPIHFAIQFEQSLRLKSPMKEDHPCCIHLQDLKTPQTHTSLTIQSLYITGKEYGQSTILRRTWSLSIRRTTSFSGLWGTNFGFLKLLRLSIETMRIMQLQKLMDSPYKFRLSYSGCILHSPKFIRGARVGNPALRRAMAGWNWVSLYSLLTIHLLLLVEGELSFYMAHNRENRGRLVSGRAFCTLLWSLSTFTWAAAVRIVFRISYDEDFPKGVDLHVSLCLATPTLILY
jgi:hypothetical protein